MYVFHSETLTAKVNAAIYRLKAFCPADEPYYLCYSGGKDSDCIRTLAALADVPHEIHHNLTTADKPETIQYIKSIPGVIIDKPCYSDGSVVTMWNLIVKKQFPPTRQQRFCCEKLKEHGGKGRLKITGVRIAESRNRSKNTDLVKIIGKPRKTQKLADSLGLTYKKPFSDGLILNYDNDSARRMVEHCYRTTSTMINPIYDWSDSDVWEFLHFFGCSSNPLYSLGCRRVGCVGCPLATVRTREKDFAQYPKYKQLYINAFDRMLTARRESGKETIWESGEHVFKWWMGEDPYQLSFFDGGEG